jgi:hypothetical protein
VLAREREERTGQSTGQCVLSGASLSGGGERSVSDGARAADRWEGTGQLSGAVTFCPVQCRRARRSQPTVGNGRTLFEGGPRGRPGGTGQSATGQEFCPVLCPVRAQKTVGRGNGSIWL